MKITPARCSRYCPASSIGSTAGCAFGAVPAGEPQVRVAETTLNMDVITSRQIDEYLSTSAWEGKAGAFGYQDGLAWVHVEQGSESNVVGLPMELLAEMLSALTS